MSAVADHEIHHKLAQFRRFDQLGGKFRVAVVNACNLDCFFCHNEAMPNPRRRKPGQAKLTPVLRIDELVGIVNAYTRLGGRQVNITGGEPLAWKGLPELMERIYPRNTRVMVNTNALLADRLLAIPKLRNLDGMLASLHTTNEDRFERDLGQRGAAKVMRNIVALRDHGYTMNINYSLGPWNKEDFKNVLAYALDNGLLLKVIALVRPNEDRNFYRGDWTSPGFISDILTAHGAKHVQTKSSFGGRKSVWTANGTIIQVKNVAHGRLRTDFCKGCSVEKKCGEGIYGLRVGVDGAWKPCLLNRERHTPVLLPSRGGPSWTEQILDRIDAMVGDFDNARYATGAPA